MQRHLRTAFLHVADEGRACPCGNDLASAASACAASTTATNRPSHARYIVSIPSISHTDLYLSMVS
jgi:hypothetical protein